VKSLLSLNPYFYKYRFRLASGVVFVALSNVFSISRGEFIKNATNAISKNAWNDNTVHEIMILGLLIVGFAFISGFFMFLMRQTIIVTSRFIEYDLKNAIYKQYQHLDLSFYRNNNTGDLMNRISDDVSKVRMYVGPAIMYLVNTLVTVVTVVVFMLKESPQLTWIVLLPLPFLSFLIFRLSNVINKRSHKAQKQLSKITSSVQEAFSGIRLIKSFQRENYFIRSFSQESENYLKDGLALNRSESLFQPFVVLMVGLSLVSILYFGGSLYSKGHISIGSLPQFVFYVYNLTWPFASLGWVSSLIQRASASQERINDFLDTKSTIKEAETPLIPKGSEINFISVSFTYPETGIEALKSVSFKIEPGEKIGISGLTGSGKTTLSLLLCRLMDPSSGKIDWGEHPYSEVNLKKLRERFGYVPQDVFLFSDTIRNNLIFGCTEDKSEDEIVTACKAARIHESIMSFPKQYETKIGERGITLSGGQKQRVSLARALLMNPEILLIDDALNAVDVETEKEILDEIIRDRKNKTLIIISHRTSALQLTDRVLFFKNGKLTEEGSHLSLIRKKGDYAAIHKLQSVKNED
jgi:ATP-binding cassette subfamily B protein